MVVRFAEKKIYEKTDLRENNNACNLLRKVNVNILLLIFTHSS